jgi:hypothetical protein
MNQGVYKLLPGMKFMSGGVLYRGGDILPDTADVRELVLRKKAEYAGGAEEAENTSPSAAPEGYEAQSVRILESLAKERGVDIPRGTNKAGIVELLKAWDAEHAGGEGDEGTS